MLQNIIDILQTAKGETENIRIAQGKYLLPDSFRGAYKQIKKEIRWEKNTL